MSTVQRKRSHPHGCAIDPEQVKEDIVASNDIGESDSDMLSDMFVTMCFFARLGFVQPPSCLKCAYHESKENSSEGGKEKKKESTRCNELVPWRRDANIPLHPDKLDGNVVFVTCDTAKSLVNGDAYPSIRWDTRNKRLLHEI